MSVLDMQLSEYLDEAIGEVAINAVIESGLVRIVERVDGEGVVFIWSPAAAEQIGQTIIERFRVAKARRH